MLTLPFKRRGLPDNMIIVFASFKQFELFQSVSWFIILGLTQFALCQWLCFDWLF